MKDKNIVSFKKARFHLSESCCTSTSKLVDIDENDEICMNSLDELDEDNNKKDKDHSQKEN